MTGLTDTHFHLTDPPYTESPADVLARSARHNVHRVIVPGYNPESWKSMERLQQDHPSIAVAIGIHPGYIPAGCSCLSLMETYHALLKPAAIGEIGLDSRKTMPPVPVQEKVFREQLILAAEWKLPVIVHCVGAHAACLSILKELHSGKPLRGVLHRVSCSAEIANRYVETGLHLGFGPDLFDARRKKLFQVVRDVPLDNILLETDAPYCRYRDGGICHPWHLPEVLDVLAAIRNLPVSGLADILADNTFTVFGI